MENDIFLPIYFYELYPKKEQNKIDLYSINFYRDTMKFYNEKASEKARKEIIHGIKYLSYKIKNVEDSINVIRTWDMARKAMLGTEFLCKQKPNLVTEFKNEVTNILNIRGEYLIESREKELKRLREENTNTKIINISLVESIKNRSEIPIHKSATKPIDTTIPDIIEIEKLSVKIYFKHREKFKSVIKDLSTSLINPQKANGVNFTALASIFYNSGWISKKDISFNCWLTTFSEAYHRLKIPSYKETQVKDHVVALKRKVPFLDLLNDKKPN